MEKTNSKKIISLLLAFTFVLLSFCGSGLTSFADDGDDNAYVPVYLDNEYEESFETTDEYDSGRDWYYDTFNFDVPEDGQITLTVKSDSEGYLSKYCTYTFINEDDKTWIVNGDKIGKKYTISVTKSNYYMFVFYEKTYKEEGEMLGGSYKFKLKYKPSFSAASINKLEGKKKAFKASWKKAKKASGYEITYADNKKFKNAKTVTVSSSKTLNTTVKKLKGQKKYYVKVRTFKTVDFGYKTKTYYSKWSKVKTVKIK